MTHPLLLFREFLKKASFDAFMLSVNDEYQGEYLADYAYRIKWLSGFSGSAGFMVITPEKAVLFTDGRYELQASLQLDTHLFSVEPLNFLTIKKWIERHLSPQAIIGYDGWLHTIASIKKFQQNLINYHFKCVERNPVDDIWHDQPEVPKGGLTLHPLIYAGVSLNAKKEKVISFLHQEKIDALFISQPDAIAWLLNIRGQDVPHQRVKNARGLLCASGAFYLFSNETTFSDDITTYFHDHQIYICAHTDIVKVIENLSLSSLWMDPFTSPYILYSDLTAIKLPIFLKEDPITLLKACKNMIELDAMRAAHIRDGAAITNFLGWLHTTSFNDIDEIKIDEIKAAEKLLSIRQKDPLFLEPSFSTISGFGANSAIIHYAVTPDSNRAFQKNNLYLVDSGGQYHDGTTDLTRTISIGEPSLEQKDRYTRVLKGHIGLAQLVFPKGTTGHQIDAIARLHLWQVGLDYPHGTGHGVGAGLFVHEGPQRISPGFNQITLQEGMILSNEPGYYKPHHYGIRLENLMIVEPSDFEGFLCFETISWVPFDRDLIIPDLLNLQEKKWLNMYHKRVKEKTASLIDGAYKEWFERMTAPLS